MELCEILKRVDHTLLTPTAMWEDIQKTCDEGIFYQTASVCIPPSFVRQAADYAAGRVPICTVIGFPNGYMTTAAKCFEAQQAVTDGAAEIDMVIHLGWVRAGMYDAVLEEINQVKQACSGKLLKVIIETCLLTEEEKIRMCETVSASNADFIKTSTGFSTGGATQEDIILMKEHMAPGKKIKAAGGVSGPQAAAEMIRLGADRIGTSRVIAALIQEQKNGADYETISNTAY